MSTAGTAANVISPLGAAGRTIFSAMQFSAKVVTVKMPKTNFLDLEADQREFDNCDFSYCVFERAYFRRSRFKNCIFIGCRFERCNFRGCTFDGCDWDYSSFDSCYVNPFASDLVGNQPAGFGTKKLFLKTLRLNARSIGDYVCESRLLPLELDARRQEKKNAWWPSAALGTKEIQYYRSEYGTPSRKIRAFFESNALLLQKWLWGYGESGIRLIIAMTIALVIFAATNVAIMGNAASDLNPRLILGNVVIIVLALLDLAMLSTKESAALHPWVLFAVVVLRYMAFGLLVSVVFRRWTFR